MICRQLILLAFSSLLLLASASPVTAAPAVRGHWLGLDQIRADTNSAHFLAVWQLPQTQTLLAQTLNKISRLPSHGATNAASALLRPLLDDLVSAETYFELYAPTNSPLATRHSSLLLALRLAPDRARLWQTNLPAAFPSAALSRAGAWTLVALGADANADALAKFAHRLTAADPQFLSLAPRPSPLANPWLTADLDPQALPLPQLSTFNFQLSTFSHLHLTLTGYAGQTLTHATLDFAQPLALQLPPWEIPTNLLYQNLTRFTAVRGFASWLAANPLWQKLALTPAPNQACFWAHTGLPFQAYVACPLPAATNQLNHLADRALTTANPWLATHGEGHFESAPPALLWRDAIVMSPFLQPATVHQHDYLITGLTPLATGAPVPIPDLILQPILHTPNLVYYQSELTGTLVDDDLLLGQTLRLLFHLPQMPPTAAATQWLMQLSPHLGGCATALTWPAPAQLTLTRTSTLGLTAMELHLLADWLESSQFPHGLHTFQKSE